MKNKRRDFIFVARLTDYGAATQFQQAMDIAANQISVNCQTGLTLQAVVDKWGQRVTQK